MDRTSLSLPGDQDQLIDAVAARQPPHDRRAEHRRPGADAVAARGRRRPGGLVSGPAVRPRDRGGAVRRRRPRRPPAGHLPGQRHPGPGAGDPARTTTRASNGVESYDEGLDVGYRWYDATGQRPLFPFGYGLSYEQLRGLRRPRVLRRSPRRRVRRRAGHEHLRPGRARPPSSCTSQSPPAAQEPPKQLKGYTNVTLAPARAGSSLFRLKPSDLAYYNQRAGRFTVAPGRYTVLVGTSSTDLDHAALRGRPVRTRALKRGRRRSAEGAEVGRSGAAAGALAAAHGAPKPPLRSATGCAARDVS